MGKIVLLIFTSLLFIACGGRSGDHEAAAGPSPDANRQAGSFSLSAESVQEIGVKTVTVEFRECHARLRAMGKILTPQNRKAIVGYSFPARVAFGHVRPGDWVKTGQALVTLESEEVGKAMAEFFKATADSELARINLEREERLFQNGVGAKKSFLSADTDYKIASANLEAAEKKLHVLGFSESQVAEIGKTHRVSPRIVLYSPIDGKVVTSQLVLGAMTEPATEILTIIDPSVLWIDAEIYEKDIACIRKGQKADITVPAYPEEKFGGVVSYIGDALNEETRTITVRAEMENREQRLKPGMFADIHIHMNGQRRLLTVQTEALLEDGEDKIVFVANGKEYIRREVQTGAVDNGFTEIVSGLKKGDRVVVQGHHQLKSMLHEELHEAHIH